MVAPYTPVALPVDCSRKARRRQLVRIRTVVTHQLRACADVQSRNGYCLVCARLVGYTVVTRIAGRDTHLYRRSRLVGNSRRLQGTGGGIAGDKRPLERVRIRGHSHAAVWSPHTRQLLSQ